MDKFTPPGDLQRALKFRPTSVFLFRALSEKQVRRHGSNPWPWTQAQQHSALTSTAAGFGELLAKLLSITCYRVHVCVCVRLCMCVCVLDDPIYKTTSPLEYCARKMPLMKYINIACAARFLKIAPCSV